MESTAAPLDRTAPLHGIAELFERPGPFLTVVLETDPATPNAAQLSAARWRAQRDSLGPHGVPAAALDAVEELVPEAHLEGGPATYVVADADGVLLAESLAALPAHGPVARWAPLPRVVPVLADRQARLPHVVVRCDREGADVLAVDADANANAEPTAVTGDRRPFRHARSVGWQELRGWHRAERTMATTAEEIATAVTDAAARIGATLVVVAGEDQAVPRVVERLAAHGLDARAVDGGRGGDGSEAEVDEGARRMVSTVVAEHQVAAAERFKEHRAHDLAVEGADATLAALSAGRVEVLFVHDDGGDDRIVDDIVRSGLATSASILVVPEHAGPSDGIGGLLRWA